MSLIKWIVALSGLYLLASPTFSQAQENRARWALGLGMESRLKNEVNPDYQEIGFTGVLHGQVRYGHWTAVAEVGQRELVTNSGLLKVQTMTTQFGGWGRYGFREPANWSPFAALGAGGVHERVKSTLAQARDDQEGLRGMVGLGVGITAAFWEHLLTELEVRHELYQDRTEGEFSAIARAGFIF